MNYCMIIECVLVLGIRFCEPGKSLLSYKQYLHAITYEILQWLIIQVVKIIFAEHACYLKCWVLL